MAELYGKVEGCSHGYGGSMHLYDVERGNLGANAVVGGGLPAITGAALSFQLRGEPRVALAFFGDGATNIGTFHEALNLAQLWRVPAVFVCENNHWAESTPASQQLPIEDLAQRAEAFGMHSITVDGQDVEEVWSSAREALEHARSGDGPVFLLANTYRLTGHYVGDPQVYRDKEEFRETRETQDPLDKLRDRLELSDEEWERLDARGDEGRRGVGRVREERDRSGPRGRAEERLCLSSPTARRCATRSCARCARTTTCSSWARTSRRWAARWASRRDARRVRAERVRNTPISEMALVGTGVGAAMQGMRPVVEVMYEDFLTLATEQIINQAAKHRYMSGGQLKVPLTVRTQGGAGWSPARSTRSSSRRGSSTSPG